MNHYTQTSNTLATLMVPKGSMAYEIYDTHKDKNEESEKKEKAMLLMWNRVKM